MASKTKILRQQDGVILKEVTLPGDVGPVAVAYSVSSRRTPEVWNSGNLTEATRLFDAELARCSKLKS